MTSAAPTQDQCLNAMHHLRYAADDALVGYYMAGICESEHHRLELIRHLTEAVSALGYSLQRTEPTP